jgi:hypothetical protein
MVSSRQARELEDMKAVEEFVKVARNMEHEELQDSSKAALGHIAGYLARSATRGNTCGACADLLVDRDASPLAVRFEDAVSGQVESIAGPSQSSWIAASS